MSNNSPLMKGIISIVTIMFFVPAVVYGRVAGTIKSSKDIVNMLIAAMKDMGGYIVLVFVSAQFTSWFSQSNLATVFAVKGAEFLENTGITGIGLIIGLIIVSGIINLFIGKMGNHGSDFRSDVHDSGPPSLCNADVIPNRRLNYKRAFSSVPICDDSFIVRTEIR